MVSKTPLAISVTMEGRKIRDIVAVQGTEKKKNHIIQLAYLTVQGESDRDPKS